MLLKFGTFNSARFNAQVSRRCASNKAAFADLDKILADLKHQCKNGLDREFPNFAKDLEQYVMERYGGDYSRWTKFKVDTSQMIKSSSVSQPLAIELLNNPTYSLEEKYFVAQKVSDVLSTAKGKAKTDAA